GAPHARTRTLAARRRRARHGDRGGGCRRARRVDGQGSGPVPEPPEAERRRPREDIAPPPAGRFDLKICILLCWRRSGSRGTVALTRKSGAGEGVTWAST